MVITTLHHTGDRARLVPTHALVSTSSWRDGSTASAVLGTTGLEMFATAGNGIGNSGANCPAGAVERITPRPSRLLAPRST